MQNLESYQNLELQKQLAKIQIISTFQSYLKKVVSLSVAQKVILQKAGISSSQHESLKAGNLSSLLEATYVDPATIFGPSLALLSTSASQSESRSMKQNAANSLGHKSGVYQGPSPKAHHSHQSLSLNGFSVHSAKILSPSHSKQELPALSFKKKFDHSDADELNDFFQKRVSNASTNCSYNMHEDEIDTGKHMRDEKDDQIDHSDPMGLKGRKRTKVICGHPWKTHHAKGLCKNCYETFGKTRKPWKCEHQAHFAKGYCKKCYLRLRQKISVKDIFPFAIEEIRKRAEKKKDSEEESMSKDLSKDEMELCPSDIKEEAA